MVGRHGSKRQQVAGAGYICKNIHKAESEAGSSFNPSKPVSRDILS